MDILTWLWYFGFKFEKFLNTAAAGCKNNTTIEKPNVITLGQAKSDNINRMITITGDFLFSNLVNGTFEM